MSSNRDPHDIFLSLTHGTYIVASNRSHNYDPKSLPKKINILTLKCISRLLYSLHLILIHCFYHYSLTALFISAIIFNKPIIYAINIVAAMYILITVSSTYQSKSSRPGLYFSPTLRNLSLIANSPILNAEYLKAGSINQIFSFTPWVLTGDLCTMLPYLVNDPPRLRYMRRWATVPLAHGPRNRTQIEDEVGKFEAVAIDYILSENSLKSLIILAGLSGGSDEGYCRDLVSYAVASGWNCFVMLGRGLAGEPNLSIATFNGARTSDFACVAKLIKKAFGGHVMAVGISLGGILISNSMCRNELEDSVDAGVCISGCCENSMNQHFVHSRKVWQPILAQGVKEVFSKEPLMVQKLYSILGNKADDIVQSIHDVYDFDCKIITPMNLYDNVEHYYQDVSATAECISAHLIKPLLIINALDDPITNIDCIPSASICGSSTSKPLSDHLFTLLTEKGGHVGWPLGWAPWRNRWEFQNRVTIEFFESVVSFNK